MKKIYLFLIIFISANILFAQESPKKEVNKAPVENSDKTKQKEVLNENTKKDEEVKENEGNSDNEVKEEEKYESSLFKVSDNGKALKGVGYYIKDEKLPVPFDFTAKDVENDGGGVIELNWKYLAKDKPESFDIMRRDEKSKEFKKIRTVNVLATKYTFFDKTADINGKYEYKVKLNGKEIQVSVNKGKYGRNTVLWSYKTEKFPAKFVVFRTNLKDKKTKKIGEVNADKEVFYSFRDDTVKDGIKYTYKIIVKKDGKYNESKEITTSSEDALYDVNKTPVLFAAIFLTLSIITFIKMAKSGKELYIRRIAGLDAVDDAVGRATEMGREIMFVPGIGDIDDPQTIAGLTILGRVAKLTAQYKTPLSVPVSKSMVMVTGREIVKESYLSMGRPENFQPGMVYYLTDDQFGFAAGVDGIMVREKPATIFLQGSFFAESLILAETGHHVGAIQISGTAAPSQLPFFITACDYTLMGEELYAASAYLSRDPQLLGSLRGQDAGKLLILIVIIVGIILETIAAVNPDLQWLSIKKYFHIK